MKIQSIEVSWKIAKPNDTMWEYLKGNDSTSACVSRSKSRTLPDKLTMSKTHSFISELE
jgi:hypothetical protein